MPKHQNTRPKQNRQPPYAITALSLSPSISIPRALPLTMDESIASEGLDYSHFSEEQRDGEDVAAMVDLEEIFHDTATRPQTSTPVRRYPNRRQATTDFIGHLRNLTTPRPLVWRQDQTPQPDQQQQTQTRTYAMLTLRIEDGALNDQNLAQAVAALKDIFPDSHVKTTTTTLVSLDDSE
ncbi:hypothetical protein ColTof4_09323 [Colletotrichum tofieldiae]|nr:hypothetical protein ColTof3_12608 [Colletotrichum tofieldiae]GKT76900.1 hypothetical protein ColTof4_09323 [Colletotrichum tofieldiae]GKT92654.1 hypothetical protein Ct61P_10504 [Colletotrichum tofieldiae]